MQYVSKDQREAVLFAFQTYIARPTTLPPVFLRGLDEAGLYEVEGVEGMRSGAAWMNVGVMLTLGDFQSTVRRIRRISK